jgi:hypothetical protein
LEVGLPVAIQGWSARRSGWTGPNVGLGGRQTRAGRAVRKSAGGFPGVRAHVRPSVEPRQRGRSASSALLRATRRRPISSLPLSFPA